LRISVTFSTTNSISIVMRVVSFAILTIAIALGSRAGAVDVFISAEESPPTPEPSSEPWIEPWQQNDAWEKFRTPWRYPAEKDSDDESYFRPEPSPEYYEPMETAEPSEEPFFPNNSAYKPTIVEPKTPDTYNFEIKFVHSLKGFTKYLDSAIKKSSAEFTNSSVTDWSLVEYRLVNDSKSTPRSHNSTSGTPQTWVAVYRAKLKEWPAKKYSNYVNSGKLGEDLSSTRQLNSSGLIETSLLRRTVQDEETNIQTNAGPIEEKPKEETKKKSGPGFGWQIGTGVGLLALVAASAMGAYFFGVHRKGQERKRRINESFPTLSRTHSGTPSALDEQRTTSMRPPPRGADVLRGTAGIRSWQENAAQKANPAPAVGSGSLGRYIARNNFFGICSAYITHFIHRLCRRYTNNAIR